MSSNQFDQEILELVNNERADAGLDPLSIDSQLDSAANLHTDEMAQADQMSHQLPGEAGLGDRVSATGYDWNRVGENVAAGQATPEEVMYHPEWGWMNSPGHRDNILNPEFTHIGVGYENAPDDNDSYNDQDTYWTQVFGAGDGKSETEQPENNVEDDNSNSESETEQPENNVENDNFDSESEVEQPENNVEGDNSNSESELALGAEYSTSGNENSDLETSENSGGNNFDQQILDLVNNERANAGLDPLSIDSQLDSAANLHTNEMVQADRMSHQLPGEAGLGDRVSATGYDWNRVGENVAAGQATPEEVMYHPEWGWMNSPGHRANILNPDFTSLGVGYENAPDNNDSYDDQDTYWTQVFGSEFI